MVFVLTGLEPPSQISGETPGGGGVEVVGGVGCVLRLVSEAERLDASTWSSWISERCLGTVTW